MDNKWVTMSWTSIEFGKINEKRDIDTKNDGLTSHWGCKSLNFSGNVNRCCPDENMFRRQDCVLFLFFLVEIKSHWKRKENDMMRERALFIQTLEYSCTKNKTKYISYVTSFEFGDRLLSIFLNIFRLVSSPLSFNNCTTNVNHSRMRYKETRI